MSLSLHLSPSLFLFTVVLLCLVGWFLNVLVNYQVISRTGPKPERLTILRAATHETELGDFCLSRSHYTETDPTSRERAATAGIESWTSSPGAAHSTDWATPPPPHVFVSLCLSPCHSRVSNAGFRSLHSFTRFISFPLFFYVALCLYNCIFPVCLLVLMPVCQSFSLSLSLCLSLSLSLSLSLFLSLSLSLSLSLRRCTFVSLCISQSRSLIFRSLPFSISLFLLLSLSFSLLLPHTSPLYIYSPPTLPHPRARPASGDRELFIATDRRGAPGVDLEETGPGHGPTDRQRTGRALFVLADRVQLVLRQSLQDRLPHVRYRQHRPGGA